MIGAPFGYGLAIALHNYRLVNLGRSVIMERVLRYVLIVAFYRSIKRVATKL